MSEDIFMLYQKEIDAIVKRGYKDAFVWLKEAAAKFPEATVEELLAAATSLIKDSEAFGEGDQTDVSSLTIPEHKHLTKATINKVKKRGTDAFWAEPKSKVKHREVLHPVREETINVEEVVSEIESYEPSIESNPIFHATKNAILAKDVKVEEENVAVEVESLNARDLIFIEEIEAKAAAARREAAEESRRILIARREAAEAELVEAERQAEKASGGEIVAELVEDELEDIYTVQTVETVTAVVAEVTGKKRKRSLDSEEVEVTVEALEDAQESSLIIKNKEYVAPEELTVDNTLRPDYILKKKRRIISKGEAASIGVENTVEEKPAVTTPESVTPEPVVEEKPAVPERSGPAIAARDTGAESDIEVIEIDDKTLGSDVNLTLKNKEYVAPEELTVDNTLRPDYIIKKKEKEKEKRRGFFGRGPKLEEGEIGVEDSVEIGPITPILSVSQEEAEETIAYLEESERPWDTEITGKLTEKTLASETDVKLKGKEYVAPEELIIDNSLPKEEKEERKEPEIVELDDKVIVSDANLTIKSKEYVAPADMTFDNSLKLDKDSGIKEQEEETSKKRGVFGGIKKKDVKPIEATKIVYLPAKPIDKNVIAASTRAEDIEGVPVYRPKKSGNIEGLISDDFVAAVAADVAEAKANMAPEEEESFFPEVDEVEEVQEWDDIYNSSSSKEVNVDLDFASIAREIEQERANKERLEKEAALEAAEAARIASEAEAEERKRLEEELEQDYVEGLRENTGSDLDKKKAAKLIQELKKFDLGF